MGKKGLLFTAGLAAGTAAGFHLFAPPYLKSAGKGMLYGAGLKQIPLDGLGRIVVTIMGKADHPPCFAQIHEHAQYVSGVSPEEFYITDGRKMVETIKLINDWYGMDVPLAFTDSYNFEAEALGAKMIYGGIDMPTIDYSQPLITDMRDIDRINTHFQPDWGRVQYIIDSTNAMTEICGLPKLIVFCAPFSLAAGLHSYPKLIRDMRRDPKAAHELLTWITEEVLPRYLGLIKRETGAMLAIGADAWAAFPNLTPEMVEEWVVPYNAKLRQRMFKEGLGVLLIAAADHCEEHAERFDRDIMEACWLAHVRSMVGANMKTAIPIMGMGRTQDWPLEWLQDYAVRTSTPRYGKKAILASINARFVREGPAEAIVDYVKRVIDVTGREGKLFIFFAQIPAATPPQHVHAAIAAMRTYGRYPIAEDLDQVKFEMPEFEPFEEWLRKRC
jgi:uroporphyrinogen-III decarboxylase